MTLCSCEGYKLLSQYHAKFWRATSLKNVTVPGLKALFIFQGLFILFPIDLSGPRGSVKLVRPAARHISGKYTLRMIVQILYIQSA